MAQNGAEILDAPKDGQVEAEQDGESLQFLTFTVGKEEYGVDIMKVREVKGWTETTRLPNTPEYMRGVLNLRGIVIPIFDLRARFGGGLTEANEKNVVVILAVGHRIVGVLADTVSDIITVNSNEIKASPKTEGSGDAEFVGGLIAVGENDGDRMVALLKMENLFDQDEIKQAANAKA
ncbi:MAG: chemotaxis protein CheW [Rickettsiales bacterium]